MQRRGHVSITLLNYIIKEVHLMITCISSNIEMSSALNCCEYEVFLFVVIKQTVENRITSYFVITILKKIHLIQLKLGIKIYLSILNNN